MRDVWTCAHGGPPPYCCPYPPPYRTHLVLARTAAAGRAVVTAHAARRRGAARGRSAAPLHVGPAGTRDLRLHVTAVATAVTRAHNPPAARGEALLQPRRACAGPGGNQREQARRRRVVRFLRLVPRVWNLTKSHGLTGTRAARSAQAAAGRWSGPGRARASTALGAVSRTQRACRSETQKILCAASSSARRRSVLLCADRSSPSRRIAFTELADAGEPGLSYCASTGRERAEA